ncbi:MAG: SET domain-containing protein-lysine N-methyltransferase, partial [Patescibacteria group bacterium]
KITVKSAEEKGAGSFANAPISKNETLVVQGGRIMNFKHIEESDYEPFYNHCFQIEKELLICPIEPKKEKLDGIFQINHSCGPNCGFYGQIVLIAMRDIRAGEEITYDYAMTDANTHDVVCMEMKCLCGAKDCRGIVTGEDWKDKNLQKKYRGFFSTYMQEMIEKNS